MRDPLYPHRLVNCPLGGHSSRVLLAYERQRQIPEFRGGHGRSRGPERRGDCGEWRVDRRDHVAPTRPTAVPAGVVTIARTFCGRVGLWWRLRDVNEDRE